MKQKGRNSLLSCMYVVICSIHKLWQKDILTSNMQAHQHSLTQTAGSKVACENRLQASMVKSH